MVVKALVIYWKTCKQCINFFKINNKTMKFYSAQEIEDILWEQDVLKYITCSEKRAQVKGIEPESLSSWDDGICYLKSDGATWINLYEAPYVKKQIFQLENNSDKGLFAYKGTIFIGDSELLNNFKNAEDIDFTWGEVTLQGWFGEHCYNAEIEIIAEYNNQRFHFSAPSRTSWSKDKS